MRDPDEFCVNELNFSKGQYLCSPSPDFEASIETRNWRLRLKPFKLAMKYDVVLSSLVELYSERIKLFVVGEG